MNDLQKRTAQRLINLFERGDLDDDGYANTENDGDGNGITVGKDGFCTGTGDALQVIRLYAKVHPVNRLTPYVPELDRLAQAGSDDVSHLAGFAEAWKTEAQNPTFRAAQNKEEREVYYLPALALAGRNGFWSPLAQAAIYDAGIQRGLGVGDPDGLEPILRHARRPLLQPESKRLWVFLQIHRVGLQHPSDTAKTECWSQSVSRVDVWLELLAAQRFQLELPFTLQTREYEGTVVR